MRKEKFQIGWYVLKEDTIFRDNSYQCAAWYQDINVPAGQYPVYSYGYCYDNKLDDLSIVCKLDGIVTQSDFSSHFGGVRYGNKVDEEKGKKSTYILSPYAHALARWILKGDSNYELLPEFEAREIRFTSSIDGEEHTTYGIFKKEC